MKKKFVSLLCAAAMALSLAACGAKADAAYAGQTLTGRVTAVDGSTVTLALGELTEDAMPSGGDQSGQPSGTPPEMPGGDSTDGNSDSQQPPEMPSDGDQSSQPSGTPPEKPDDDSTDGGGDSQQPSEMPGGDQSGQPSGTPPEKPDGDSTTDGQSGQQPPETGGMTGSFTESGETATVDLSAAAVTRDGESAAVSDVAVDDILTVTFDDSGAASEAEIVTLGGGMGGAPASGFGGSSQVTQGDSANTIRENGTYTDTAYTSTGDDENALRVDGAAVTLDGITVDKSGGAASNTENGDFYGVNAALLATNGASVTITNAKITSSAQNGNGVFSYGSGTTVNISNSVITTTADNSGGIQTTGGGTTNASNLTVNTSGNSSAAIRSDRGGGTVNVSGGSYTSNGYNSPAVYSTADITVENATLTANNSEALVIEGKNSITLEN